MNWEGTVFGGKYLLGQKLGQGGMGSVWRAEHVQLRSPVAIKLIEQSIATNPEALARFMREAQSAAALRSPHVVQILDHGADHGVPYIAMELLEGESLAGRLEREIRLTPQATSAIMTQVTRAILKAHEAGIVHRDLKPDNIFIVKNDDEEVAKVLDFGIAKTQGAALGPSSSTRTGALLGTPYYMSPEQAEGNRLVDFRTDIWALGVIAFECIVGRRPFESEAFGSLLLAICTRPLPIPSTFGPVPPGFDAWFGRACAREPDARFPSAREAAADLRRVCAEGMLSSGGVGPVDSHARTTRAQTPFAETPGGYPPAPHSYAQPQHTGGVRPSTPHPAGPTANPFTASVEPEASRSRSRAPLLIALVLGAGTFVLGGLGVLKVMNDREAAASAASAAAAAALPPPAPPEPKVAVDAPPPPRIEPQAAVAVTPSVEPAPSASAPVVAPARPVAGRPRGRPTPAPAPAPVRPVAPTPAPPAAATPPPAAPRDPAPTKPKINLGI